MLTEVRFINLTFSMQFIKKPIHQPVKIFDGLFSNYHFNILKKLYSKKMKESNEGMPFGEKMDSRPLLFHSSLSSLPSILSFQWDVLTGCSYTSPKGKSNAALFSSVKAKPAEDSFIASIVSRTLSP